MALVAKRILFKVFLDICKFYNFHVFILRDAFLIFLMPGGRKCFGDYNVVIGWLVRTTNSFSPIPLYFPLNQVNMPRSFPKRPNGKDGLATHEIHFPLWAYSSTVFLSLPYS